MREDLIAHKIKKFLGAVVIVVIQININVKEIFVRIRARIGYYKPYAFGQIFFYSFLCFALF